MLRHYHNQLEMPISSNQRVCCAEEIQSNKYTLHRLNCTKITLGTLKKSEIHSLVRNLRRS